MVTLTRRGALVASVAAIAQSFGAAGAIAENDPSADDSAAAEPIVTTHTITIAPGRFRPRHIDIKVGDVIVWVNETEVPNSAWDLHDNFDTGMLDPGKTASFAFNAPGTYAYRSRIDVTMRGTIAISRD